MKTSKLLVGVLFSVLSSSLLAHAQTVGQSFTVPKNVTLYSGDSWRSGGQLYRLYGVQSCLRGTAAIAKDGTKSDCGDLSLARLGALLSTGTVSCQPIGKARDNAIFGICAVNISGDTIDIGTALISSGYAFSAVFPDGKPVDMNYLVAELTAKGSGEGLWAYQFPHPVQTLLNTRQTAKQGASQ
jgi:endonuclease YncB( thermonuclease family)